MTGEMEAAGDIATGALVGRALEPRAGEVDHVHGPLCLNCAQRLDGPYCRHCGQAAHVHDTVASIAHDLLHGVFHFEGKIWRTLPMLVLHPGELTRRYAAGERARFVSPMAIFLFSVFLMFAVVAHLPGWDLGSGDLLSRGFDGRMADARAKLSEEQVKAEAELAAYTAKLTRSRTRADAEAIGRYERRIKDTTEAKNALVAAQNALPRQPGAAESAKPAGENWFEERYRHATENPKLLLYKLKTSAYKYSWALIPLSLPFIWLLFPLRRDVGIYDHAVFATYSLTFMSLLIVALAASSALGLSAAVISFAALLIPPVHLYKQFKYGYRLSRAGALWRTFWMLLFASITLSLFVALLLYLGLAE